MDAVQASFDCSDLENPMGERRRDALRLNFDRKLKLQFHGTKVTNVEYIVVFAQCAINSNLQRTFECLTGTLFIEFDRIKSKLWKRLNH